MFMRNRVGTIFLGLAFMLIGLGFMGDVFSWWSFELFFDGWWTLFIILPCISSIISRGPQFGNLFGLTIGGILLLGAQDVVPSHLIGELILPLIFILIGLAVLFRGRMNDTARKIAAEAQKTAGSHGAQPSYCAVFSGQKVSPIGERFEGCEVTAVFGGVDLHLENSIIDHDIVINATAIFGGVDIFLPASVKVVFSSTPIFGGVSNKRPYCGDDSAPTVCINAVTIFGGMDIK